MLTMSDEVANTPATRVELHAHLDGCVRLETIWELMKEKNMELPGNGTFRDLRDAIIVTHPVDLAHFLEPFQIFLPCLQDDLKVAERVAYEFCEDKARNHVAYVEARYSPKSFLSENQITFESQCEVVKAIYRGFLKAENDFKIKARSILCLLFSKDANETLRLCETLRNYGVVAIDRAGSSTGTNQEEEVPLGTDDTSVYLEARRLGIGRTIHAGERGPAEMVRRAVEVYDTQRVGHGYHVLEDNTVYEMCKSKNIHFECCPWSSLLTGAVPLNTSKHPIVQFFEDNVNFSLNTDDTTITGKQLRDDYELASSWNLTEAHFVRANLNAARSSFLPEQERQILIKDIVSGLGIN